MRKGFLAILVVQAVLVLGSGAVSIYLLILVVRALQKYIGS